MSRKITVINDDKKIQKSSVPLHLAHIQFYDEKRMVQKYLSRYDLLIIGSDQV